MIKSARWGHIAPQGRIQALNIFVPQAHTAIVLYCRQLRNAHHVILDIFVILQGSFLFPENVVQDFFVEAVLLTKGLAHREPINLAIMELVTLLTTP